MNFTAIDIETEALPLEQIQHLMPDFKAPANYKDADKIAANIEEQRQAWIADAALSPLTGRIIAIGYAGIDWNNSAPLIHAGIEDDMERVILLSFWEEFATMKQKYVGHNIHGFDIPFIVRRSWFHKINIPTCLVLDRGYINGLRFIDTMKLFQVGNSRESFISLDRLSKFLGLPGKTEDIGATWGQVFRTDPDRAMRYLERDLELTAAIAKRLGIA